MTNLFFKALQNLYPQVVSLRGGVEALDSNGNLVEYDQAAVENQAALYQCKAQAQALLQDTDWVTLPDITTGTHKLTNQTDFLDYRNSVRALAINPVANPTFPTLPTEQWGS
jgi:hypothetical protein